MKVLWMKCSGSRAVCSLNPLRMIRSEKRLMIVDHLVKYYVLGYAGPAS
jgi:hypothetical protein